MNSETAVPDFPVLQGIFPVSNRNSNSIQSTQFILEFARRSIHSARYDIRETGRNTGRADLPVRRSASFFSSVSHSTLLPIPIQISQLLALSGTVPKAACKNGVSIRATCTRGADS